MNKKNIKNFVFLNCKFTKVKIIIIVTLFLSFHPSGFLANAENNYSNDVVVTAKQLQLEGTRLQLQGDIGGAIKKYQESLALQPNTNLEGLLLKLEKQNSKVEEGSSGTQGAVVTVEPVGQVGEPAKPIAQPVAPVTPVVDRQGSPGQQAPPVPSEATDKAAAPVVAGESQPTTPPSTIEPPEPAQAPKAAVLSPQEIPAVDQHAGERPEGQKEGAVPQQPVTTGSESLPVAEIQHSDAKTKAMAEPAEKVNQQTAPPLSQENQVLPTPVSLSQTPESAAPQNDLPVESTVSPPPKPNGEASGSAVPIASPHLPAQKPVQTEMAQPAPQPLPVPTKIPSDGVDLPANPAGPDRVEQSVPASPGNTGQVVSAEEVQVEQRPETAHETKGLPVESKGKGPNAE